MDTEIKTSYKDFSVIYIEFNDGWRARSGDIDFRGGSLADVKKKIDVHLRKESKFKNMEAFKFDGYNNDRKLVKVTITSVTDEGDIWIKNARGSRSKDYKTTCFYKVNEHNSKMDSLITEKMEAIKILRDEIINIEKNDMESIKFQD